MMTGIFLSLALLLGYATTVALSMASTFAVTFISKEFVVKDFEIRGRYKLLQDVLWLPCAVAGGIVASWVGQNLSPWLAGTAFLTVLLGVLWTNAWEMRQRGIPHQLAMSAVSIAGVVIGFLLRIRSAQPQ
ncbi:MAG: hypothetical protein M3Y50_11230 [Acidobacteriota bacterium]|nr:hypothetical protein [Acidobacteriota bacterium]